MKSIEEAFTDLEVAIDMLPNNPASDEVAGAFAGLALAYSQEKIVIMPGVEAPLQVVRDPHSRRQR